MRDHLRVAVWPCESPDSLGETEKAVLRELDPPLNLDGMAKTEVRRTLSLLRSGPST